MEFFFLLVFNFAAGSIPRPCVVKNKKNRQSEKEESDGLIGIDGLCLEGRAKVWSPFAFVYFRSHPSGMPRPAAAVRIAALHERRHLHRRLESISL
jgi:hypothetical protein